jgi:hypothetical protein
MLEGEEESEEEGGGGARTNAAHVLRADEVRPAEGAVREPLEMSR